MEWIKRGLIYVPNGEISWQLDRAIAPVCDLIDDNTLRVYFSSRDKQGRSTPIYLETDPEFPEKVRSVCDEPILAFGKNGSFDDSGILVSSIVKNGNDKYFYYVGWNARKSVPYHLSIGLAKSTNGSNLKKISQGPILDRSINEPYFNTAPFVLLEDGVWKMWCVSCNGWLDIDGQPEPIYDIKYTISNDGISWLSPKIKAIQSTANEEAIGKPFIFRDAGILKMIYSFRGSRSYRTSKETSYKLGYAESIDDLNWVRKDYQLGIKLSEFGWDSEMMEYASSYDFKGRRYMLYNGNGFGESGFGYAVLSHE